MKHQENSGEGNREADRRYRNHVEKTVQDTTESERSKKARDVSRDDLEEAHKAEEKGREHARK